MTLQKVHPSVPQLWDSFIQKHTAWQQQMRPESWHFCDNKKDANECLQLALQGIKRATSTSIWYFDTYQQPLPKVGDLAIITNWDGEAKAIIQTTKVEIISFEDITPEQAKMEGEGDQSLAYWRKVHWDYYAREMQVKQALPRLDMLIAYEQFRCIWPE